MKRVVLDSDIIIDYLRTSRGILPDLLAQAQSGEVKLFVSVATAMELYSSDNIHQRQLVEDILDNVTIIELDRDLARLIGGARAKLGKSVGFSDLIIGITTKSLNAEIATRNKKHFEQIPGIKFYR